MMNCGLQHITQLKIPNGIQYKRAMQRCCHETPLFGQQKKTLQPNDICFKI